MLVTRGRALVGEEKGGAGSKESRRHPHADADTRHIRLCGEVFEERAARSPRSLVAGAGSTRPPALASPAIAAPASNPNRMDDGGSAWGLGRWNFFKWAKARVGQFLAINRASPWNLVMIPRAAQIIRPEESQIANVTRGPSRD